MNEENEEPEELVAIPEFADEEEAQAFWEKHDAIDYLEWADVKPTVMPATGPATHAVTLVLPATLIDQIKVQAAARNMEFRELIEVWLKEKTAKPA